MRPPGVEIANTYSCPHIADSAGIADGGRTPIRAVNSIS